MAQTYIQELMAKRQRLVDAARAIADMAAAEKRDLTAAEQTEYDKLDADIRSYRQAIDRLVDQQESTRQMDELSMASAVSATRTRFAAAR